MFLRSFQGFAKVTSRERHPLWSWGFEREEGSGGCSSGRYGSYVYETANVIYNPLAETYQAAFFFQKTEPHNVIIKVRAS